MTGEREGFLRTWGALAALCLTMFIVVLDTSMMNVAVPRITEDLGTGVSQVQSVISLYSLVMASLMLAGAKLGTVHGAKRVFRGALLVYGAGTLLATVSWNILSLGLGWSVIEGVAAAALLPITMSLVIANYRGARRALAFGVLGGFQATAAAIGPIFGGFLTTVLTWRLGFAFEVVVVVVVLAMLRFVEGPPADRSQSIDWPSAALSVLGLGSIVVGSLLAGRYGWWNPRRPFSIGGTEINPLGLSITPWVILFGLAMLVILVHRQGRLERAGSTPLIPTRLFSNGTFVTGFSVDALQSVTLAGLLFVLPLFLQTALGYDALGAGVVILPLSLTVLGLSMVAPGWGTKIEPKLLVVGGTLGMAGGLVWLSRVASATMTGGDLAGPLILFGAGTGLVLAHVPNLTLSSVDQEDSSDASGLQNAAKETGTSLGTAVIGAVLLSVTLSTFVGGVLRETGTPVSPADRERIAVAFEDRIDGLTDDQAAAVREELDTAVGGKLDEILLEARVAGFRDAVGAVGIFVVLAILVATFLPRGKLESAAAEAPQPDRIPRRAPTPQRGL